MLNHGLDQPLLDTNTGHFQVTFSGPAENMERLRVPEAQLSVTPAVEAQLNERQKKILSLLVEGEELTSRRCEEQFGVTRETTSQDFKLLIQLGLAKRIGQGRSTRYLFERGSESSGNRQANTLNRQVPRAESEPGTEATG
jgi:predicted HTH transcriptional regulator